MLGSGLIHSRLEDVGCARFLKAGRIFIFRGFRVGLTAPLTIPAQPLLCAGMAVYLRKRKNRIFMMKDDYDQNYNDQP